MPITGSAPNKSFTRTVDGHTGSDCIQQMDAAKPGILSVDMDETMEDMADGIRGMLLKDGGTQPSANLPMNSFKHTGVANATARTEYAAAGQVADNSLAYSAAGGTGDVITATLAPAITAYATGMLLLVKAGAANTGAATVNVNTMGAKTIKKGLAGASDLDANDIKSGKMALFAFDGTNMQHLNAPEFPSGTTMLFVQTASPTGWTKSTTHNNKALRIVSGTTSRGGLIAFTTAFASQAVAGTIGDTALSISQIPAHTHGYTRYANFNSLTGGAATGYWQSETTVQTSAEGSGASHTHTFTGSINLDFSYVDCIIATKD